MSNTYFLTFNADGFLTFTKINCQYVFFRKIAECEQLTS